MLEPEVDAAFRRLVAAFAADRPLPAGGAAAVTSIAMGIGLGLKVLHISAADGTPSVAHDLGDLLEQLLPDFAVDCEAFARLLEALRLPRDDEARPDRVRAAWEDATAAPIAVARLANAAESHLAPLADGVKPSVRADLAAALDLISTGRRIAERNARDNATRLDPARAQALLSRLDGGGGG